MTDNDNFDPREAITQLGAGFEPHNLAKKVCEAIKEQVTLQSILKDFYKTTLKEDVDTQNIIRGIIWKSWKVVGSILLSIVLAFIGGGYLK